MWEVFLCSAAGNREDGCVSVDYQRGLVLCALIIREGLCLDYQGDLVPCALIIREALCLVP